MQQLSRKWRYCRYSAPYNLYRHLSTKNIIKEGDVVLLRRKRDAFSDPILTLPLQKDRIIKANRRAPHISIRGTIPESDIIGKGVRDVVCTDKNDQFRIHEPSLAEYLVLSPRLVTPIYPKDASLIVSLLDLHPTSYTQGDSEAPLEIFEAGTGHGSLTLYLSRAIHGANSHPPTIPPLLKTTRKVSNKNTIPVQLVEEQDVVEASQESEISEEEQPIINPPMLSPETSGIPTDEQGEKNEYIEKTRAEYEQWLPTRRAIVQTLDISAKYSEHAQQIVRYYRRGLYYGNINFHVGTIHEYLSKRLDDGHGPFLQHAILDLPQTHTHMEIVGKALKPNGLLLLFCPNITQINESVRLVKKHRMPFLLENVLEIGGASGSGGREWDVKMTRPRATTKAEATEEQQSEDESVASDMDTVELADGHEILEKRGEMSEEDLAGWNMVCHPKFGARINVGAFIAVWRRMEEYRDV